MVKHYWSARLVKDGPTVPILTLFAGPIIDGEEQDRSPRWQALVRTETTARPILMGDHIPIEIEGVSLRNVEAISPEQYHYLVDHARWATRHDPTHPEASPETPIDWNTLPVRI